MEHFPDGTHVLFRYENHYLYATGDGSGISPSTDRASLKAVWTAQRLERNGIGYVLFHGAAYGRYLGLEPGEEHNVGNPNHHTLDVHFEQRDYGDPAQNNVLWQAKEAQDGTGGMLLVHQQYDAWATRWIVEAVPPRANPPELPPRPPAIPPPAVALGGTRRIILPPPEFRRRIQYVRANHGGDPTTLWLDELSVFHLRNELARRLGEANALDITLCVRAGSQGRLTPLVVDLPRNWEPMFIVVLATGSPAAQALVYPNVDA